MIINSAARINNFKFLIKLIITQTSEFFNLRLLENSLALAEYKFERVKHAQNNYFKK